MEHPRSIVTGAAGFIGSHLAERLVELGHDVIGVDSFTPYYLPSVKRTNLEGLLDSARFQLVEADLITADLEPIVAGADYVFHQAAQAGVRASWGKNFVAYTEANVLATQRLLEAVRHHDLRKFVYASSSSVYGNAPLPMRETSLPQPVSPYGVTKLAAEHLCDLYRVNYGVPTVSLRYFTVYGPRQRPDMAIHKFIRAALSGEAITLYGDGSQSRDFTYVADIVRANILAAQHDAAEGAFNIGGGTHVTLRELLMMIQLVTGRPTHIVPAGGQRGDVGHTASDSSRARDVLDFAPSVPLAAGLEAQVAWHRQWLADQVELAG